MTKQSDAQRPHHLITHRGRQPGLPYPEQSSGDPEPNHERNQLE